MNYEYYVYENGRRPTIHIGECADCHHGNGKNPKGSSSDGKWHGPFTSLEAASGAAYKLGGHIHYCKHCDPERRTANLRTMFDELFGSDQSRI